MEKQKNLKLASDNSEPPAFNTNVCVSST